MAASRSRSGAARIAKIVSSLQTFSGRNVGRRTTLDVREVLARSCELSLNELRHRARVVTDYAAAPLVEVDEARLSQVFVNLLVHVAHALPEEVGTSQHAIHVATATGPKGEALVRIHGTGPGLAAEVLPHVFEPFTVTNESACMRA